MGTICCESPQACAWHSASQSLSGKLPKASFCPHAQLLRRMRPPTLKMAWVATDTTVCTPACRTPRQFLQNRSAVYRQVKTKAASKGFLVHAYSFKFLVSGFGNNCSCRVSCKQALSTTRKRKALNINIWYVRQKFSKTALSGWPYAGLAVTIQPSWM